MSLTFTVLGVNDKPVVQTHDFATAQRLARWGRKQVHTSVDDVCDGCANRPRTSGGPVMRPPPLIGIRWVDVSPSVGKCSPRSTTTGR